MTEECTCEDDKNELSEFIMTILEGLTFLCAIFVTILYTWEFHDKYSRKKTKNRKTNCMPRIRSSDNDLRTNSEELQAVFDD
tara:strand:- start:457 stop:702 length:246 start_codon:yes stop_codon:yes gene_type:complete